MVALWQWLMDPPQNFPVWPAFCAIVLALAFAVSADGLGPSFLDVAIRGDVHILPAVPATAAVPPTVLVVPASPATAAEFAVAAVGTVVPVAIRAASYHQVVHLLP